MLFKAKAKYVWYSPYKLRPLVDVIRGKTALEALNWLSIYKTKRSIPVKKLLQSAIANAMNQQSITAKELQVAEICVDQGPMHRYFKPGAMGRAVIQRKRLCHISITLKPVSIALKSNPKEA